MAALNAQEYGALADPTFLNGGVSLVNLDEGTGTPATSDSIEFIFQAQEAATLSRLGIRYGARTGTPPTYKMSLEGVDGSGRADGTIKGGGSPASLTFTPPADATWNSTFRWFNLDNTYVCTRGEDLAVRLTWSAGTINGTNFSSFASSAAMFRTPGGRPYAVTYNATGAVTSRVTTLPLFGYGSSGVAYGYPFQTQTNAAINSGTTPDEIALKFTLPAGLSSSYQIEGARVGATVITAATTHKLILYDTDGTTVLQTRTWDSDHVQATTNQYTDIMFTEGTLATLIPGSTYRLSIQPQAATSITLVTFDFSASGDLDAWPGGSAFLYSEQTNAGGWSDQTARRPMIVPLLSDLSSGGPLGPGRLTGGLQ